ncbi:unnamed protein product [Didymodactylos carnosus]|uniref:Peptidase S1 domain-containing protein n=1 Tax=Didymodactylos carnosus TaxID=1234261 RepID=A0A815LH88_9BILA|nr:unnamed protein product [Didymodactylos carnosus]CAF1410086.1 unnamed protein product [Didymodactylos carnosus]CAF3951747.1 unnamed protein product [Didymodactylos carnosus]CAF4299240.1 unnamed protein product [Didymodactylos carnosus]
MKESSSWKIFTFLVVQSLLIFVVVLLNLILIIVFRSSSLSTNTSVIATTDLNFVKILLNQQPCAQCGCPFIQPVFEDNITSRIVNGEIAQPHSWPWHALLVVYNRNGIWSSACGASLLSSRYVLTAAHCVHGHSATAIYIHTGLHEITNKTLSPFNGYQGRSIYIHESYSQFLLNHDIALIKLKNQILQDNRTIGFSCLDLEDDGGENKHEEDYNELFVAGWGRISGNPLNYTTSTLLKQLKLNYISPFDQRCAMVIGQADQYRPGQMCAWNANGSACRGDSGGALVRRVKLNEQYYYQQVGIVSGSISCGFKDQMPETYTRIKYYTKWIKNIVQYAELDYEND